MNIMFGIILSFLKTWTWLTYIIIEAAVLTIAFNYLAPNLNSEYLTTWKLPFDHISYWHVFAFFVVIKYVGQFIQTITPKIAYFVNNKEEDKTNEIPRKKY